jgi:DNA mismatch endonuclease Vsr
LIAKATYLRLRLRYQLIATATYLAKPRFPKRKVAVFVDGCFWRGCPKCYTRPKTNQKFWDKKREDNMARDQRVNRQLRRQGWKVIRIWQHALQKSPSVCLNRIRRGLCLAAKP